MGKYYGKYRARVIDINDPEERGRIRIECPAVLGKAKSAWCETCVPVSYEQGGDFGVPPHLGDTVWVEFEQGDWNKPIWVGSWWSKKNSTYSGVLKDGILENVNSYGDAIGKVRTIEWRGIRMTFAEDGTDKWRFIFDMVQHNPIKGSTVKHENITRFEVEHDDSKENDTDKITLTTEHSVILNVNGVKPEVITNVKGSETAEIKFNMDCTEDNGITKIDINCSSNGNKSHTLVDVKSDSNGEGSKNTLSVGLGSSGRKSETNVGVDIKSSGEECQTTTTINAEADDPLKKSKSILTINNFADKADMSINSKGESSTINFSSSCEPKGNNFPVSSVINITSSKQRAIDTAIVNITADDGVNVNGTTF